LNFSLRTRRKADPVSAVSKADRTTTRPRRRSMRGSSLISMPVRNYFVSFLSPFFLQIPSISCKHSLHSALRIWILTEYRPLPPLQLEHETALRLRPGLLPFLLQAKRHQLRIHHLGHHHPRPGVPVLPRVPARALLPVVQVIRQKQQQEPQTVRFIIRQEQQE